MPAALALICHRWGAVTDKRHNLNEVRTMFPQLKI